MTCAPRRGGALLVVISVFVLVLSGCGGRNGGRAGTTIKAQPQLDLLVIDVVDWASRFSRYPEVAAALGGRWRVRSETLTAPWDRDILRTQYFQARRHPNFRTSIGFEEYLLIRNHPFTRQDLRLVERHNIAISPTFIASSQGEELGRFSAFTSLVFFLHAQRDPTIPDIPFISIDDAEARRHFLSFLHGIAERSAIRYQPPPWFGVDALADGEVSTSASATASTQSEAFAAAQQRAFAQLAAMRRVQISEDSRMREWTRETLVAGQDPRFERLIQVDRQTQSRLAPSQIDQATVRRREDHQQGDGGWTVYLLVAMPYIGLASTVP